MLDGLEKVKDIFPRISFDNAVKRIDNWIFHSLMQRLSIDSTHLKLDKPGPTIAEELFPYNYSARSRFKVKGVFSNRWVARYSLERTNNPAEPVVGFSLSDRLLFHTSLGENILHFKIKSGSFHAHWDLGFHQIWRRLAFQDYSLRYGAIYLNPYFIFEMKDNGRESGLGVGAVASLGDIAQVNNRISVRKVNDGRSLRWQQAWLCVDNDFIFNLLFSLNYRERWRFDYRRAIAGFRLGKTALGADFSISAEDPNNWIVSKLRATASYAITPERQMGVDVEMENRQGHQAPFISDVSLGYTDKPQKHLCLKAKASLRGIVSVLARIQLQELALEGVFQTSIKSEMLDQQPATPPTIGLKISFAK